MARLIPFSYSFSTTDDSQDNFTYPLPLGKEIRSLTIYVETDNVGPIHVAPYVLIKGKKHHLGEPEIIFDGDGYNYKIKHWVGRLPIDRYMPNTLYIDWSNYCGDDADIRFTGTVEK